MVNANKAENNRMGKTGDLLEKISKGTFHAKMGSKGQKKYGLNRRILRGVKNTQKNCTKKIFMTQITTMV